MVKVIYKRVDSVNRNLSTHKIDAILYILISAFCKLFPKGVLGIFPDDYSFKITRGKNIGKTKE
jgi:hypothetical protein